VHEITSGSSAPAYVDDDPNGVPQVLTTTTGAELFYGLDGMGSPTALVLSDGTVSGTYAYDPYGTYSDTDISGGSATPINPYRYALAGLYDRDTQMLKYGQRWYNPSLDRFTQQDSIEHPTVGKWWTAAGRRGVQSADRRLFESHTLSQRPSRAFG